MTSAVPRDRWTAQAASLAGFSTRSGPSSQPDREHMDFASSEQLAIKVFRDMQ